jgi:hypothetical protein
MFDRFLEAERWVEGYEVLDLGQNGGVLALGTLSCCFSVAVVKWGTRRGGLFLGGMVYVHARGSRWCLYGV